MHLVRARAVPGGAGCAIGSQYCVCRDFRRGVLGPGWGSSTPGCHKVGSGVWHGYSRVIPQRRASWTNGGNVLTGLSTPDRMIARAILPYAVRRSSSGSRAAVASACSTCPHRAMATGTSCEVVLIFCKRPSVLHSRSLSPFLPASSMTCKRAGLADVGIEAAKACTVSFGTCFTPTNRRCRPN